MGMPTTIRPRRRPGWRALLSVAAFVLVAGPVAAQDAAVIRRLGSGSGADAIGTLPPGVDVEGLGPSALFAGRDGKLYLLDQINGRILSMDTGKPAENPEALELPEGLIPQDMVAVKDRLYVWDGRVHSVESHPGAGGTTLEARAVGDPDDVTRSAFAQMGSQAPSSESEALGAAGRAASSDELGEPIRQTVASQAFGAADIEILPGKDGKSARVELRPEDSPLDLHRYEIKVSHKLGSIEVLDVVGKGDAYVFTENIPPKSSEKAYAHVLRFDGRNRLAGIYDLPISADQYPSRRFVTVTPEGKVLYLKSDASGVAILDLAARKPPRNGVVDPPRVRKVDVASVGPGDDDFPIVTAIRPGTRLGAIQTGLAFEGLKWTVTARNYGPDPDRNCAGFDGRTRRPGYLAHKVGQEVRGVPYCWGCFGSFVNFKHQVDRGVLAGNWCTREDPHRDVVGVDCSAFVSQCWGLSRHYTTADIPSITERLANPWDLKPGDALNKPGSHVMLFVKFTPDRKVEVLEASTGGCNGRVCRNVYPLSVLLARGYQPVRNKSLKDK